MGYQQHSAVFALGADGAQDDALVQAVKVGGGLVQQQERCIVQERPRHADALPLAAGKGAAQLAHGGVVALGQAADKVIQRGLFAGSLHLFLRGIALCDADVVADGIRSLSELLKNTLINDHEFITIGEEIANLKHYFSIQTIRYAGSFHVNYEIPEDLTDFMLPKLILQPLAENSVLHGSYNDGTVMEIYVRCYQESADIILEVEDHGKGFDMNDKSSVPKGLGGIGSRNVNDRIHLYFSDDYGMTVSSAPGKGALCRIRIPSINTKIVNAKEGETYVPGTDRR